MATTVPWRGSWWINIYRSRMEKETIYWKSLRTDQQDGKSPCSKEFYARNLDTENPNLVKITHTHTHTYHAYRKQPFMEAYRKERFMIYNLFSLELSSPLFCLRTGAWDRKRSRRRCCLDNPLLEAKKSEQEGRKAMSRLDFSFPWEASPQESELVGRDCLPAAPAADVVFTGLALSWGPSGIFQ